MTSKTGKITLLGQKKHKYDLTYEPYADMEDTVECCALQCCELIVATRIRQRTGKGRPTQRDCSESMASRFLTPNS